MIYVALVLLGLLGLGRSQCSTNGFFPHESQCDGYYECRNGTVIQGLSPRWSWSSTTMPVTSTFAVDLALQRQLREPSLPAASPRAGGQLVPRRVGHVRRPERLRTSSYNWRRGARATSSTARKVWPSTTSVASATGPTLSSAVTPKPTWDSSRPEATSYDLQDFANPPYPHPRDCAKALRVRGQLLRQEAVPPAVLRLRPGLQPHDKDLRRSHQRARL
uniref:Putative secreted protein n=1 Tax=Ixodes ricinus TaxID=34613 RepID=V5IC95_IXORI